MDREKDSQMAKHQQGKGIIKDFGLQDDPYTSYTKTPMDSHDSF